MKELDKPMYYGAKQSIIQAAHILRRNMTFQECLLWDKLKMKQINGLRFRRQHPIDIFIVDFYCHEARLIVEVDGEIHKFQKEYDMGRSAEMEKYGLTVLRFTNAEVENNIDEVISKIKEVAKKRIQSPPGGFRGECLQMIPNPPRGALG